MSEIYYVKYKDDLVGVLEFPSLKFTKNMDFNGPLPLFLFPYGSTIEYNPTKSDIREFLTDRVVQSDNQGIDQILEDIGLSCYNVMGIIDETCGMVHEDFYWLLKENTKHYRFKTHHQRGILESMGVEYLNK